MWSYKIVMFTIFLEYGTTAFYRDLDKIAGTWYVVGIVESEISVKAPRCWIVDVEPIILPMHIQGTSSFINDERNERIVETFVARISGMSDIPIVISYGGKKNDKTMYSGSVDLYWDGETDFLLIDWDKTFFYILHLSRDSTTRPNGTKAYPPTYVDNTACPWNEIRTTEEPDDPVDGIPNTPGITVTNSVKTITQIISVDLSPTTSTELPFHDAATTLNQNSLMSNDRNNGPDVGRPPIYFQSRAHCSFLSNFFMLLSFVQFAFSVIF